MQKTHSAAIILILSLTVIVLAITQRSTMKQPAQKEVSTENPLTQNETRIERIERLFIAWGEKLMRSIDTHVTHQKVREQLKVPFSYVKRNRNSKVKLYSDYCKKNPGHTYVDRKYFYYAFRDFGSRHIVASYNPGKRMISLGHDFDPKSTYDMLVLYHEIMHVSQGDSLANMLSQKEYRHYARIIETNGILVGFEIQAFAWEIEILNTALGGHLAHVFRKGGTIDVFTYMRKLNIPDSRRLFFASLVKYASMYYPEGYKGRGFSRKFTNYVISRQRYARPGVRLYRLGKNHQFIELR